MLRPTVDDVNHLAARLHGRRSRMAEASRLENLCRLPDFPELGRAIFPGTEFHAAADFQRRLAQDLVRELSGFLRHVEGVGADVLGWMLVRFQVENIKVLVRAFVHRTPLATPEEFLLSLPHDLALDVPALLAAGSLAEFAALLPVGAPRKSLRQALDVYHDQSRPFFLEAALDRGYLQELLHKAGSLTGEDRELITPILLQETDAFHLLLVARGKFHYGLPPELLWPLHVRGSGIPSDRFNAMLTASDVLGAAGFAVGRAIDALPSEHGSSAGPAAVDASLLEALAWRRYLRLSNRAFRRSHLGLGAVIGYVGIRRAEVANLITLSEGIRVGEAAEAIRARLIPRADLESVYV